MLTQPKDISKNPGVYIFKDGKGTPIYIGKAANIKKRLSSYWKKNAGTKAQSLLNEAVKIEWIETDSEIDALIKEAELIKKHYPRYNIVMRDDKNYFYVAVTKEDFPKIYLTHQPYQQTANSKWQMARTRNRKLFAISHKLQANFIGPFTSGSALKTTLRMLRGIFPYCTCKEAHKRPCLNAQIGRCFGFCCQRLELKHSNILQNVRMLTEKIEYRKNIQNILAVLRGRKKRLLVALKREMHQASKSREFEKAAKLRDQIVGFENIFNHAVIVNREPMTKSRSINWVKIERNIQVYIGTKNKIWRVEGYDISNISGTEATGSMVVFVGGKPSKSEYRKFKIKTVSGANDIAMHTEVIRRRLSHSEWQFPDLIVMDGGKPQLSALLSALDETGLRGKIFASALAKREEELYIEGKSIPILLRTMPADTGFFFQRVRDESHRFAKKYHHKLREILYREKKTT